MSPVTYSPSAHFHIIFIKTKTEQVETITESVLADRRKIPQQLF